MASSTTSTPNGNRNGHAGSVQLRTIPLSRIVVKDNFNPRGEVHEDADLRALAETMRQRGCLQPIRVRANEAGDYELVAGERRYRAAALAALTEIPASIISDGETEQVELLVEAMIENELRSDLDPLQRAQGYQAMIDGGLTIRGVAERLGGTSKRSSREKRIREHLEILALPERLRRLVAAQQIPLLAIKALAQLAQIHEDLATAAVSGVLAEPDYDAYSWQEVTDNPIQIAVNCIEQLPQGVYSTSNSYPVAEFELGEKAKKDLAAYAKLTDGAQISRVSFNGLIDQARALGAVHEAGWFSLIVGQDVATRLAEDYIAGVLKQRRATVRRERASQTASNDPSHASSPAAAGAATSTAGTAEDPKAKRAEEQQRREEAIAFNLDLGLLAFKHLPKVKVDERVLRILASVNLGGELREIATRGARLALPGWVTQTTQRNGKTKTICLDTWGAQRKAVEFLEGANSPSDIAGRALTLIALASLADEDAIAKSNRSNYTLRINGPWEPQARRDLNAIIRERIKEGQSSKLDDLLAKRIAQDEEAIQRAEQTNQAHQRITDACAKLSELTDSDLAQLEADVKLAWDRYDAKALDVRAQIKAERARREQPDAEATPATV